MIETLNDVQTKEEHSSLIDEAYLTALRVWCFVSNPLLVLTLFSGT